MQGMDASEDEVPGAGCGGEDTVHEGDSVKIAGISHPVTYHQSIGNVMDCMKAVQYSLLAKEYEKENDEPMIEWPFLVQRGIEMHKDMENYIKQTPGYDPIHPDMKDFLHYIIEKFGPFIHPELELKVEIGEHKFGGRVDAIGEDGWVYDWKFVSRPWDELRYAKYARGQAWLYLWMLREMEISSKGLRYLVIVPENPYDYQKWDVRWEDVEPKLPREISKWKSLHAQINNAVLTEYFPASPSTYRCRFCFYKRLCPHSVV